ncbi:putative MICOS complex subunit Mic10, partial [Apostichopus japonicus]
WWPRCRSHIFCLSLQERPWPIAFGGGVGLGMGYANCQHEFNDPYNLRARIAR